MGVAVHSWGVHTKGIKGGDDALRVKLVCVVLYILGGRVSELALVPPIEYRCVTLIACGWSWLVSV